MQYNFKNIHELIKETHKQAPKARGTKSSYNNFFTGDHYDPDWIGGITNINDYTDFTNKGYLPAVEELNISAQTNEGNKHLFSSSVCGQFGDVAKYLNGEPECMFDFEPQEVNNYLTINISGVTPGYMQAKDIQAKCKAVFNAVNELELKNTRCKIYLTVCTLDRKSRKEDKNVDVQILVKDFEDNFIPSYHGLILGHLTTIRGLIYSFISLHNKTASLGSCREADKQEGVKLISYHKHTPEEIIKIITQ
ncbi:MAG: hypothetical protein ACK5QX_03180 [bacterium]|jgi:hypothetical protein